MFSILISVALAAFTMKPGLWEVEHKTLMNGEQSEALNKMNERMKSMTPAQREQINKMMAGKGMGLGDNGAVKVCHSNKDVEKSLMQKNPDSSCKITDKKNLSNGIAFDIKCDKGNGKAEYRKISDTKYSGWNEFQTEKGKMKMEFTGKYLSANCGDIKPIN